MSSLEKCQFKFFAHFLIRLFNQIVSLLHFRSSLNILKYIICKYSLPFYGLPFTLWVVSLRASQVVLVVKNTPVSAG